MKNVDAMRWVMEVDYHDLALNGITRDGLERLFANSAAAGIRAMFWSVAACGRAEYPSRILPQYDGRDRRAHSQRGAAVVRSFDSLGAAVALAKQYGIRLSAYFRLFDDYWPGMEEPNLEKMGRVWWESRCGQFQLKGWPCYALPEVRDYKLRLVREIADYGVDGFLFGLTRSHSLYVNPFRQPNFWGFNQPWADEYQKRHGVDIRRFDQLVEHGCNEGSYAKWGLTFINRFDYVGAAEFDLRAWHELKAECVVEFLRQARRIIGPDRHLAIEAHHRACVPTDDPADDFPARLLFHPAALAREGIINEWVTSDNWRAQSFRLEPMLRPHLEGMAQAGAAVNAWLNDLFMPQGGGGGRMATAAEVGEYLRQVRESGIRSATIHEADFLLQHPECEQIWKLLRCPF